jgi:NitT/TauT family transport system permease protein
MVGAQSGLGFLIWNAWQILQVNVMYVGLITIAVIGFVLTVMLNELERLLIPSRTRR